jgi:hypothetical protein
MKRIIPFLAVIGIITASCSDPVREAKARADMKRYQDSVTASQKDPSYKSIVFVDSFYLANKDSINKNAVIKQSLEAEATNFLFPKIEKGGFYEDLPFEFATSDIINGKVYGNFVFNDEKHFVKVQCIISPEQIKTLAEKKHYFIKFKTYKFEDGVTFEGTTTYLPTAEAYLTYFREVN